MAERKRTEQVIKGEHNQNIKYVRSLQILEKIEQEIGTGSEECKFK